VFRERVIALGMPWLKLYTETIWDSKLRSVSVNARWMWIACLCLAGSSPVRGELRVGSVTRYITVTSRVVTDAACMTLEDGENALNELINVGLIVIAADGAICVTSWEKRQSSQGVGAVRQRRYRERKKEEERNELRNEPRNDTRNALRNGDAIEVRSKDKEYNPPTPLTPREEKLLEIIAPYTMTSKEIHALCSTFTFTDEEIVAAMAHPNAKRLKSPYLYLRNWLKRSAGKTQPSEFKRAVSGMFDQFAAEWPNRDCLGEARAVFLDLFPEEEDRQAGRDRVRAINAHAKTYLDRTEKRYVMRLSKWLRTTDFSLAPEARQGPEYEVGGDG